MRWLGIAGSLALVLAPSTAGADISQEAKIKAAIVYKVTKFIEWPQRAFTNGRSPVRICHLGRNHLSEALAEVSGRSAHGRALEFKKVASATEVRQQCHLVFVGHGVAVEEMAHLLLVLSGRPVLTISDTADFTRRGGVLGLTKQGKRIRFEVNLDAARSHGLVVSAPLLELADVIEGGR